MNYKEKYFKYKNKYLNLKKIEHSNYCKKVQKGGGAVTYCYLCGAPIDNYGIITLKNLNKYKKYLNDSGKLYQIESAFKEMLDLKNQKNIPDKIKKEILNNVTYFKDQKNIPDKTKKEILNNVTYLKDKKYKWMNDLLLLHWSGMILKIASYDGWEHQFKDNFSNDHFNMGNNFIVHKDCYEITKHKYGDYNSLNMDTHNKGWWNENINYGFIRKYDSQEYDWLKYFYDNVDYVLESPLKNSKNKKRILKINHKINKKIIPKFIDFLKEYKKNNKIPYKEYKWMKKIIGYSFGDEKTFNNYMKYFEKIINKSLNKSLTNKKKDRPSPSESATKFKVGKKKKGNDGNMWIIVENKNGVKRWSKIK
jgi:hypothetical protein